MRLLVTGGAGFIGANLAAEAAAAGHDVVVLDDLSSGRRDAVGCARLVVGSVLDPDVVAGAVAGVDAVVHLAALASVAASLDDPVATHAVNATGTLVVLEAARAAGVQHVSVASSSAVYGRNPASPCTERDWVRPLSPYGASKLAAEQYALAYQESFGLTTLALRLFNVFGPGQHPGHVYAPVIPAFLSALLDGAPLTVHGDGGQTRDFTSVRTVCAVLLAAATGRVGHPEPVNVAAGASTSLLGLVAELERATGRTAELRHLPARVGDVRHSRADVTVLHALLPGLAPTDLGHGLAETADWFRAQHAGVGR